MKHFVISFLVTVDGVETLAGKIGAIVDYNPNVTKSTIERQYRKRHPQARAIAVVIIDVEPVTEEQYAVASPFFIELL